MINPINLRPFKHFCITIGNLPTSYVDSLSYYEMLEWLCHYLQDTVIPAVNTNANAVTELQGLYVELKNYVDTYFDNLDIQEEINNKLDEMAESGELTEIIAEYLELAGILAYNTVADLEDAQNLNDGSFVKTYGKTTYNDGYGAFYKIRGILNTDVIDGDNIVGLTNYPSLIAEKMPDTEISSIKTRLNTIESTLSSELTELVVIGDSYTSLSESNWAEKVAEQLHLNLNKIAQGSMGYVNEVNDKTFIDLLDNISSSIASKVKMLICYGGINDNNQVDFSAVTTAVTNFCNAAKTKCPNAQILIVGPEAGATQHKQLKNQKCADAIRKGALSAGCSYCDARDWLTNSCYPYNQTYLNDNLHPSSLGYKIITSKMLSVINNNVDDLYSIILNITASVNDLKVSTKEMNNFTHIHITFTGSVSSGTVIGTWTNSNASYDFHTGLQYLPVFDYINGTYKGLLRFNPNGNLTYVGTNLSNTMVQIAGDIYCGMIEY